MTKLIEQFSYNLYSYTAFIVIGFAVYLLYDFFIKRINKNNIIDINKYQYIILILLAMFLPFCNCIAVTYLLYDIKETKRICLYLLSTFIKLPNILLLNAYFGISICLIYIVIILIYIGLFYVLSNRFQIDKYDNKNVYYSKESGIINIYRLAYIYILSLLVMSFVESNIPNTLIISLFSNADKLNAIELLFISIIKYICMPNDLTTVATLIASGLSLRYLFVIIIFGTLFNFSEFLTILVFIKKKFLLLVLTICSILSIFISTIVISLFSNNYTYNYDLSNIDNYTRIINILNVNPNYSFRYISIIIVIILAVCYILLPIYNKGNQ